jgi:hypothetical protein
MEANEANADDSAYCYTGVAPERQLILNLKRIALANHRVTIARVLQ